MRERIHNVWQLLVATLREIFDENAYSRFLAREGMASSRMAYAAFLREREAVVQRRPRCC
ncbi:MAG TPA: hypothetical protein VK699_10510 [Terriglobales bacterium]|jgi:hypothetical protein|nr:hypothetical protein [Terriglobales bacterium]